MDQTSRNTCKICFMEQNDSSKHVMSNNCFDEMMNMGQKKCPICRQDVEGEDNPSDFIDDEVIPNNSSNTDEIYIPDELRDVENRLDESVRELKYSVPIEEYINLLQEQAVQFQQIDEYEDESLFQLDNDFQNNLVIDDDDDCDDDCELSEIAPRRRQQRSSQPRLVQQQQQQPPPIPIPIPNSSSPHLPLPRPRGPAPPYNVVQSAIRNVGNHLPMPENLQHSPPPIPRSASNNAHVLGRGSHPLADKIDQEELERLKKRNKELEKTISQHLSDLENMKNELQKERKEKNDVLMKLSNITNIRDELEDRIQKILKEKDDSVKENGNLIQEIENLKERLKYYE